MRKIVDVWPNKLVLTITTHLREEPSHLQLPHPLGRPRGFDPITTHLRKTPRGKTNIWNELEQRMTDEIRMTSVSIFMEMMIVMKP